MEKISVYVTEDDPIILLGYRTMLLHAGFYVLGTAKDGETSLKDIPKLCPDIILMDINLPDLDGLSVIEKVHEQCNIPAVVITGYDDQKLMDRAIKAGVFGYLLKPVDERNIKSTINIALNRFQEFQKLEQETNDVKTALENRKILERAKGRLMDEMGMQEAQAMHFIQKRCRDSNKKIAEVAKDILNVKKLTNF